MGHIAFTWNAAKALSNKKKHGVSFEEAQTVFLDERARLIGDPDHSEQEERFLLLGYSAQARCLLVSHCFRESEQTIRIISARKATIREEEDYWRLQ